MISEMRFERIGLPTLLLMCLRRLDFFFIGFLLAIIGLVSTIFAPTAYDIYIFNGTSFILLLDVILLLSGCLIGWLDYIHYKIILGEKDIQINRGILTQEETGLPFRRVRHVVIRRSLFDQIIGTSTLVVTVLGEDEAHSSNGSFTLPFLPIKIAQTIQDELLRKAQVEDMAIMSREQHTTI